uniref:PSP proline-rich domain-containing protein n=1 Tax=Panagrolaimus superbus TaxID=310955 RepID=A0A914Z474_9BILA
MPKRTSRLPPPPPPPIITIDDDEKPKEDGELSDEDSREAKPIPYRIKSKKKEENIPDTPAEGSDIEVIGDNLYDIDDNGCDDDGLDITMNIDDDEVFKKMQKAAGINNDDIDISINITETPKATRGQGTCFNCGGPHTLAECTAPHDRRRINRNRQSFGSTRRERITEHIESKFTPGQLSDEAKKALNLYDEEYPQWIMRMRDMGPFQGYPPGYLKRFKPSDKRLSFFCDDPHLTNETVKAEVEFDPEKIVYYDGFNLIDKRSEAERYCNQNVRKELQWKKWNKHSYPIEFEKFLKTSIIEDKAAESRKRQHGFDNNEQYSSKRDKEKERKREKRAAARKVEKENKKWQNYKLDLAKEKLVEDFKNTDISKEPEKIYMVDETFGIFESKRQRKKIDRERRRSAGSLEAEANWVKTMEEETWAAKEAKAIREELAKQEKAEKKSLPKTLKEKGAEKFAKKKAEREERDKRRLKIEKHMIEVGTQTEK